MLSSLIYKISFLIETKKITCFSVTIHYYQNKLYLCYLHLTLSFDMLHDRLKINFKKKKFDKIYHFMETAHIDYCVPSETVDK